MKKGVYLLIIVLLNLVLIFAGCGGSSGPSYKYYAYVVGYETDHNLRMYPIKSDGTLDNGNVVDTLVSVSAGAFCDAVTPNGKYLYVAVYETSWKLKVYSINKNGLLTGPAQTKTFASGDTPSAAVIDPQGKFLYVSLHGSGYIYAYKINADGTLNDVNNVHTGYNTNYIAISPSRNLLYAAQSTGVTAPCGISSYTYDNTTGALSSEQSYTSVDADIYPCSIAVSGSDWVYTTCYLSSKIDQFNITDTGSGALTAMTPANYNSGSNPHSIVIDKTGAYVFVAANNSINSISIGTSGQLNVASQRSLSAGTAPWCIALHPNNRFAYVGCFSGGNNVYAYSFNTSTGQFTSIGNYAFSDSVMCIAIAKVQQ